MTTTKPTPRTVRHQQPMRLFCVEYVHADNKHYVTTIEAHTETLARDKFDWEHPNVKVVRVY